MDTTTKESENKLQIIAKENGLSAGASEALVQKFIPFFEQAKEWTDKAKALTVTDATQVTEMNQARDGRLALRRIRINVENTRKDLKEDSLKQGKAIDGIANVLKGLIEPIEEHLEKQEKFAEIEEAKIIEKLKAERSVLLQPYVADPSIYPLGTISKDVFADLLNGFKVAAKKREDEAKQAEADRIAKEKTDAADRLRIQKENEAFRKANEEKDRQLAAARAKAAADLKVVEEKAAKEKALSVAKLKSEVEAKNKLAAEIKAKQDAEALAKKEQEAAERKAKRAPDKQKLILYAGSLLNLDRPELKSEEAQIIMKDVDKLIEKVATFIKDKITNL